MIASRGKKAASRGTSDPSQVRLGVEEHPVVAASQSAYGNRTKKALPCVDAAMVWPPKSHGPA